MTRRFSRLFKAHSIDSRILVTFLILAAAAFVFLKFASEVLEGDTLNFDRWILQALRNPADPSVPAGPEWLREAMIDLTSLGGVTILTLITTFVVGYLLAIRKYATAAFVTAAVVSGALMSTMLKLGFARARPELVAHLVDVHTASFPSGHAMNSAVTYLTLGTLLARTEQDRSVRIYLLTIAIFLVLAIGFSRVYLGVHWPSDILAGWCIGGTWAVLCSLIARSLQRRRKIEPPVNAG